MVLSLVPVSCHSDSGEESSTMPAPANSRTRLPSTVPQRIVTTHSPLPSSSHQPTMPPNRAPAIQVPPRQRRWSLSAVETVNPAIQSSIDAALLSKMAERGQITGGAVDGPLAMDNAVDIGAARTKGLRSAVAVYRIETWDVPRPRGLLGNQQLGELAAYLREVVSVGGTSSPMLFSLPILRRILGKTACAS